MFKSSLVRYGSIAVLLMTVAAPSMARPHDQSHPPMAQHRQPSMFMYDRNNLPSAASLLVISGITYAIIDGLYYQRHNDKYVYVENPPVAAQKTTVDTNSGMIGTVVNALPAGSKKVTVNGVLFYVHSGDWYAPIASSHSFVVVEPQL
jgi:hypothetical protein